MKKIVEREIVFNIKDEDNNVYKVTALMLAYLHIDGKQVSCEPEDKFVTPNGETCVCATKEDIEIWNKVK